MYRLFWDASGLAKRYALETGTEVTNALFTLPAVVMTTTFLGYAEVCSVLRRKYHRGDLNIDNFHSARQAIEQEILLEPTVELLTIEDADILTGIGLTDTHHINSADASILAAFLRHNPQDALMPILVCSDRHLLRAAKAEGITTIDPEAVSVADLPAFFNIIS